MDDGELKAATKAWFWDQTDNYFLKVIDCLKEKWAKCIEVKGAILINEPRHEISDNMVCATSKASDQPAHTCSLTRAFASRLNILGVLSH